MAGLVPAARFAISDCPWPRRPRSALLRLCTGRRCAERMVDLVSRCRGGGHPRGTGSRDRLCAIRSSLSPTPHSVFTAVTSVPVVIPALSRAAMSLWETRFPLSMRPTCFGPSRSPIKKFHV